MSPPIVFAIILIALIPLSVILAVWDNKRKGKPAFPGATRRVSPAQAQRDRLRAEASTCGVPSCPRCGSAALSATKRGYQFGRGLFWAVLLGAGGFYLFYQYREIIVILLSRLTEGRALPYMAKVNRQNGALIGAGLGAVIGLRFGSFGSQTVMTTCLNCGCQYNPSLRHFVDDLKKDFGKQPPPAQEETQTQNRDYYDPPIPPGFAEYLKEIGQDDPRYSGRNNALECVLIEMPDDKARAVMWAYAVDCALHGRTMGNILDAPDFDKYTAFSEYASLHGDILKSVSDRRAREYWNPTTTTKAYKAAVEFLK